MFDPTLIDLAALPSVALTQRRALPQCSGIYFAVTPLCDVLYIGRAGNLFSRWTSHHRMTDLTKIGNVSIAWLELNAHLGAAERACIEHFRPTLNGSLVGPNGSGKKTYAFKLSDSLIAQLAEIAEDEGRTLSGQMEWFLRRAIDAYVPEEI